MVSSVFLEVRSLFRVKKGGKKRGKKKDKCLLTLSFFVVSQISPPPLHFILISLLPVPAFCVHAPSPISLLKDEANGKEFFFQNSDLFSPLPDRQLK
jgi:hypothetical protein